MTVDDRDYFVMTVTPEDWPFDEPILCAVTDINNTPQVWIEDAWASQFLAVIAGEGKYIPTYHSLHKLGTELPLHGCVINTASDGEPKFVPFANIGDMILIATERPRPEQAQWAVAFLVSVLESLLEKIKEEYGPKPKPEHKIAVFAVLNQNMEEVVHVAVCMETGEVFIPAQIPLIMIGMDDVVFDKDYFEAIAKSAIIVSDGKTFVLLNAVLAALPEDTPYIDRLRMLGDYGKRALAEMGDNPMMPGEAIMIER